jgi:hypothetical protein
MLNTTTTEIAVGVIAVEELRRRAERLAAARHPGVVELLGFREVDGTAELESAAVEGTTLADGPSLTADELAGVAAAVATTLADLHDRGVAHGALTAGAVVIGHDGFPVLHDLAPDGGDPPTDVAALGALLASAGADGPLADLAAWAADPDPARRPTARALAAAVAVRLPGARLPGSPAGPAAATPSLGDLLQSAPRPERRRWRWPVLVVLLAVGVVGGGALALAPDVDSHPDALPRRRPAARATSTSAPTTVAPVPALAVWPPATVARDGAVYNVGLRDDIVLVSPWGCGAETATVVRPGTGEVWVYPRWATPDDEVTAVALDRVAVGATAKVVDADGDGCTDLVVHDTSGAATVLHPEVAP